MALAAALSMAAGDTVAVYAVAFGLSAAAVFFNPAASSVLPALVDEEQLVRANSGIWTATVVSQIMLAPLAGLLVCTPTPGHAGTAPSRVGTRERGRECRLAGSRAHRTWRAGPLPPRAGRGRPPYDPA